MLRFAVSGVIKKRFTAARRVGSNAATAVALVVLCGALLSCGSSNSTLTTQTPPNIAGGWEFIAISNDGSVTGIEVALTEGQVIENSISVPNGQISASSAQIAFVSLTTISQNYNVTSFGGSCGATATSTNSLGPGSVTGYGSPVTFTFTENGSVFNVTITLSGDGKSMLNGTYTPQSGNACSDPGGTITGTSVSVPTGSYTGQMCPLESASSCSSQSDSVTANVSAKSGQVNLSLALTGTDNTSFTLAGPSTGNSFSAQGTFQGQTLTYYGYFEQVYDSSLEANVPSIFLVSAADACFSNPNQSCTTATVLSLQQNVI